jgi:hypothetical protein
MSINYEAVIMQERAKNGNKLICSKLDLQQVGLFVSLLDHIPETENSLQD